MYNICIRLLRFVLHSIYIHIIYAHINVYELYENNNTNDYLNNM